MPHDTPLIATIVAGLGLAFVFGAMANRLRLSPIVGYLLAGLVVGPHTPGFVADQALAGELAEIGIILLMFGVGLHFSIKDLLSVRRIAVPGAIVQIFCAAGLGLGLAWALGWPLGGGLVFGLALSVASTVVLLRALQERRLLDSDRGRIAIGWLIVEDLAMIAALVILPIFAGTLGGSASPETTPLGFDFGILGAILVTLGKIALFVAFMLAVGRRVIPWILHIVAHSGSRELFRLAILAIALGVAFGASKLFGVSLALGAFFAGMVLSESELSQQAAEESLPFRDAFAVLFFVSVGMLFDPTRLIAEMPLVLATLFIVVIGKSAGAFLIVRAFGYPLATALTIAVSLAQIGEFSFILADLGIRLGLLPELGRDLILVGALLSIVINPLLFSALDRCRFSPAPVALPPAESEPVTPMHAGHVVLVGYGRVGQAIGEFLKTDGRDFIVIEDGERAIAKLHEDKIATIGGNAARPEILAAANLAAARHLIVAIPNAFEAGQIVEQARLANPRLAIVARAHSDAAVAHLRELGANEVIMGEREIARGMIARLAGQPA